MSITETLVAKPPPLRLDVDGNLLVGGTRVPLDTVVGYLVKKLGWCS
jgi:hypothetical protein